MPITLAESKVGMRDKVEQTVVDEFRRSSFLLDQLTFDNAVSPATGGSTLVYGYTKLMTPATAAFRALNTEYPKNEAKRKEAMAKLAIFGGAFSLDRVIIDTAGAVDELDFQIKQKIEAAPFTIISSFGKWIDDLKVKCFSFHTTTTFWIHEIFFPFFFTYALIFLWI